MAIAWICLTTFLASALTLFSGFGLGTLLMPVAALFLPVPVAVAVTALVHLLNKLFKLALLWRQVETSALLSFGVPALIAAIPGAFLLGVISGLAPLHSYMLWGETFTVTPVKLVAGILLIIFATAEQYPLLQPARRLGMPAGGALSGFFGGLTGHQGAFRSAFLVQGRFTEKGFVATNAAIAALVDATRIAIYGLTFDTATLTPHASLILAAVISSFLGVFIASRFLEKVTIRAIQRLIAVLMYALGAGLCLGLI